MANELQATAAAGATVTAKLVNAAGTVVATVTLTEGPATLYRGSVPGGVAAGRYTVLSSDGYASAMGSIDWDGTAEVHPETMYADALLNRDMGAVVDSNARSPLNALRFIRNKWAVAGGTLTVSKEDDTTTAWTAAVSSDAAADPVTGSSPA